MLGDMTDPHLPILILSGAGLPPWIWDEVRKRIIADSVVAPRPAGHADAPLSAYVDAAIEAAPAGRFAVVAHSSGGVVGSEVARLLADRVESFIAISAVIPVGHASFVTAMPAPRRWVRAAGIRLGGTRPPTSALRLGLSGGLSDEMATRIVDEFVPESKGLYLDSTGDRAWPGHRGYLVTTQDRQIPPALQRRFAQRLDGAWSEEVLTGHLPMLQDPHATATKIDDFLSA